ELMVEVEGLPGLPDGGLVVAEGEGGVARAGESARERGAIARGAQARKHGGQRATRVLVPAILLQPHGVVERSGGGRGPAGQRHRGQGEGTDEAPASVHGGRDRS